MKKIIGLLTVIVLSIGCNFQRGAPISDTGVKKATAEITTGIDGLTVEQRNVKARLEVDNKSGSIKHLYVISAYTGQVLIYSTVDGKVTSSGKRLTPTTVSSGGDIPDSIPFAIAGQRYYTPEVIQDDGTYGHSSPYVFWFDTQGNYHQHYINGGQIFHVSDEPLAVKDVVIRIGTE
jgi:hypothetical protein